MIYKRLRFATLFVLFFCSFNGVAATGPCEAGPSETLVASLVRQAAGLRPDVLRLALESASCANQGGLVRRPDLLTVIDYSISSSRPRLFVFDLSRQKLLFRELVAHGKNSGGDYATHFSNSSGSLESSLGLFVTEGTYEGQNGYSLRLRGLEEGVNDMARDRAIVMHGAYYVSQESIRVLGRLGRSWGCPAVRAEIAEELIDTIRGGSAIFAYYPDQNWLASSEFLPRPGREAGTTIAAAGGR